MDVILETGIDDFDAILNEGMRWSVNGVVVTLDGCS